MLGVPSAAAEAAFFGLHACRQSTVFTSVPIHLLRTRR
jgi:hypothetical protein